MIIVAAPFGNWLRFEGCMNTVGTFTLNRRTGRLWKILSTLRYNRRQQSWINKIGLRNPGISNLNLLEAAGNIVSIHGFIPYEWTQLAQYISDNFWCKFVELNLSCPNVDSQYWLKDLKPCIDILTRKSITIIAKLGPVKWLQYGEELYEMGIREFHLCNTIPTPGGGISGKPLKQYSLWAIEDFRKRFGDTIKITGGGGINSIKDLEDYKKAGANHYSIGSMLLNPFNWPKMKTFAEWSINNAS